MQRDVGLRPRCSTGAGQSVEVTMLSPVRTLVVGIGDHATRAFGRLVGHSEMSVGQIPDVLTAATVCRMAPVELAPHVILLESCCLATPDQESLRTLIDTAPVILLGTDLDPDNVLEGLRLGARGHVDWPREEEGRLEAAIWTVLAGRPALSPLITLCVLDRLHQTVPAASQPDAAGRICPEYARDTPAHSPGGDKFDISTNRRNVPE